MLSDSITKKNTPTPPKPDDNISILYPINYII